MIVSQLPTELIHHVLRQVPFLDLEQMFVLNELPYCEEQDKAFKKIRNIALYERYYEQKLFMTNMPHLHSYATDNSVCLTSETLDYLMQNQIYIKPKMVSLIIYNTGPFDCIEYATKMLQYYEFIAQLTTDFNIQLVLLEHCSERESAFIDQISQLEIRVNWFSINQRGSIASSLSNTGHNDSSGILSDSGPSRLSARNLKINLFNASSLVSQVELKKNTSWWLTLRMIDLSYNNIDDYWLAQIDLPETVEVLNLSNNSLRNITNYNFRLAALPNLKELILNNNNITSICFCQAQRTGRNSISHPSTSLTKLSVMGNHLFDTQFLLDPCLRRLKQVDLSRNLISQLCPFPPSLTYIDLGGNYLTRFFSNGEWNLFRCPNLAHLNLANCKIHSTVADDVSWALFLQNHPKLILVNLEGNRLKFKADSPAIPVSMCVKHTACLDNT